MNSRHFLISFATILACCSVSLAQQPQTQPDSIVSTNTEEATLRDPFWHPSYNPQPLKPLNQTPSSTNQQSTTLQPQVEQEPQAIKWPILKVKGVIKDAKGRYIAQIEGIGLAESGQTVRMKKDGVSYYWKVGEVTEKGVEIKPLDTRPAK